MRLPQPYSRFWLTLTTLLTTTTRPTTAQAPALQFPFPHPTFSPTCALSNPHTFSSLASLNTSSPHPHPNTTMPTRAPVIALSHGGGPMPILGDPGHAAIVSSLRTRVPQLLKLGTPAAPRAIVLVTAHWSTRRPTISSGATHPLLYDYYGFPPAAYELAYDAPGAPGVAEEVRAALAAEGLDAEMDAERGWDHGVFVPMMLVRPQADVPVVQVSVMADEDAERHYRMGHALGRLRESNVAVIGSGFATFHNLRIFWSVSGDKEFRKENDAWSRDLTEAVLTGDVEEREKRLGGWRDFTGAYKMHPKGGAEHFLPLVVCAGAGGEGVAKTYTDEFMGLDMWSYYWE